MKLGTTLRRAALFAGTLLASAGVADAASINLDVAFGSHVDCVRPAELANVPLKFRGKMTLKPDGTATGELSITAYYVINWKDKVVGKLGAPPKPMVQIPGGSVQLNVLNQSGLTLKIAFPNNVFTVNTVISPDNRRCTAEIKNTLKKGKREFNLAAKDILFYCTAFRLDSSSCSVS